MADDTTLDPGTGGDTIATDDIGGVKYQRVKLIHGADGTNDGDVADGNPLPIDDAGGSLTVDNAGLTELAAAINTSELDVNIASSNATVTIAGAVTNSGTFVVQEDGAALTALQLIDDSIYVDDADWTPTTSKHAMVGGVYTSAERTITDGDTGPVSLDVNGHVITSVHADTIALSDDVSNTANVLLDEAGAFVVQASFPFMFDGTTWDRVRGDSTDGLTVNLGANNDVTVTGTVDLGATDNAVLDDIAAQTTTSAGAIYAEDVASQAADPGIAAYAVRDDALAANAGVGADGDYLPLRVNNDGALWTQPTVGNLGGSKFFNDIDLDEADIDVATGPCTVYSLYCYNSTAAPLFLKLFNTNTVTMGTTAADLSIPIPANADSDGAGFVLPIPVAGVAFGTALTVAVTTGLALDDNSAPGANAANVTIMYQD